MARIIIPNSSNKHFNYSAQRSATHVHFRFKPFCLSTFDPNQICTGHYGNGLCEWWGLQTNRGPQPAFNPQPGVFYERSTSYCTSLSHGNLVALIPRPASLITINGT
jgi:hypothetical protein